MNPLANEGLGTFRSQGHQTRFSSRRAGKGGSKAEDRIARSVRKSNLAGRRTLEKGKREKCSLNWKG